METLSEENVLNVTELQPGQKHPEIFARFDNLAEGTSLTILNDHDPKPLYYQLLGKRGNVFSWTYLEEGPEWWKVRIVKRLKDEIDPTLGELAAADLRKVNIFKEYGLDYCCGGKKTVKEACAEKGLDVTKVEKALQQADSIPHSRPLSFNDWTPGFLSDYIVNVHHTYVRKTLPELKMFSEKVASVHGGEQPELNSIAELIEKISLEMNTHMMKEEKIVFPYIKSLANPSPDDAHADTGGPDAILESIAVMEMEHEVVGGHLEKIRMLSNNYHVPENGCASYKAFYKLLEEFEEDLHMHVHLENNILFVKAAELKK
ncbi:MAG: iron-sulfur cluster repair di-iron protein [Gemmatimonadaceae bacterium]|nr:iron-sulfur cluster repair di-iron protein [Chitinophagaceae bacterium]